MPNKLNQTLERLLSSGDRGLIINPFFERIYRSHSSDSTAGFDELEGGSSIGGPGDIRTAGFGSEIGAPIGWRDFGYVQSVSFYLNDSPSELRIGSILKDTDSVGGTVDPFGVDNPIWAQNRWKSPGTGVTVFRNRVGGLATRIANGPALRGKKIRIYGAYKTTLKDYGSTEVPLGVSIWLKGRVREKIARGDVSFDNAGGLTGSVWSDQFSYASGSTANFIPGDTVWAQSQRDVYQILNVVGTTILIEGILPFDYSAGYNWTLGRGEPGGVAEQANWHSGRGIHLKINHSVAAASTPGMVISMKDPGKNLNAGTEWFCAGVDKLVWPTDGTGVHAVSSFTGDPGDGQTINGGGTPGDTLQSLGSSFLGAVPNTGAGTAPIHTETYVLIPGEGAFQVSLVVNDTQLRLAGPPYPTNNLSNLHFIVVSRPILDDDNVGALVLMNGYNIDPNAPINDFWPGASPPALDGGAAPSADQCKIWYIDSKQWNGTASNGNYELLTDTNVDDGQVHYFDEVVEIPADMAMDEDELYLIVLPASPTDFQNVHSMASVRYYGIQAEVIGQADAAGDGAQDRIVRAALNYASPHRFSVPPQEIWRNPLWVPINFMVDLDRIFASDGDLSDITYMDPRITTSANGAAVRIGDGSGRTISRDFFIPFPKLPPGTVLQNVVVGMDGTTGTAELQAQIVQGYGVYGPNMTIGSYDPIDRWSTTLTDTGLVASSSEFEWYWGDVAGGIGDRDGVLRRHRLGFPWPSNDADLPYALGSHRVYPARFYLRLIPEAVLSSWNAEISHIYVAAWTDARLLSKGYALEDWG